MVGLHREGISDEEMQQEEAFVESTLQWIPAQVSVKQNSVPVLAKPVAIPQIDIKITFPSPNTTWEQEVPVILIRI